MEKLLNEEISKQITEVFKDMNKDVTLALFTSEEPCQTCAETKSLLDELNETSEKLHIKQYDIKEDSKLAKEYNVTLTPTIVVLDEDLKDNGIQFVGIPAGHEINSLIGTVLEVSGYNSEMPQEFMDRINKIDKPVDIKVFVTLGCPHCPGAVSKGHKLALENPNVKAQMIEANTFNELSNKYNVSGVPKIVINEEYEIVGNQPFETFLETIEKALA